MEGMVQMLHAAQKQAALSDQCFWIEIPIVTPFADDVIAYVRQLPLDQQVGTLPWVQECLKSASAAFQAALGTTSIRSYDTPFCMTMTLVALRKAADRAASKHQPMPTTLKVRSGCCTIPTCPTTRFVAHCLTALATVPLPVQSGVQR